MHLLTVCSGNRILLFSAFTPFLVVFTHALASHSHSDVLLLSQVLITLKAGKSISAATNRLYEVCKVFVRFATAFVESRQSWVGDYDEVEDSFTFPLGNENQYSSISDIGEEWQMGENLIPMSAFLGTCLSGNQGTGGLWGVDFSQAL